MTIPANQKIPHKGALVEIRFLYCYRDGCLYQPTYLGERDDVERAACAISQVKFKIEDEDGAE